jgi:hypothetical protein
MEAIAAKFPTHGPYEKAFGKPCLGMCSQLTLLPLDTGCQADLVREGQLGQSSLSFCPRGRPLWADVGCAHISSIRERMLLRDKPGVDGVDVGELVLVDEVVVVDLVDEEDGDEDGELELELEVELEVLLEVVDNVEDDVAVPGRHWTQCQQNFVYMLPNQPVSSKGLSRCRHLMRRSSDQSY